MQLVSTVRVIIVLYIFQNISKQYALTIPDKATLIYTLVSVDYEWGSDRLKQEALKNENYFIVENNIITGLKVYGDEVFVSVPRWRKGIPATLNQLVTNDPKNVILRPYPSWEMNLMGDCEAFQYVQSMEVDPNTGFMWVIDTGRVNTLGGGASEDLCPPKIVIYDMAAMTVIRKFEFPSDVASPTSNFLNDIVLDYVDGKARYAYISGTSDGKLYVYDFDQNTAYFYQHSSMNAPQLLPGIQDGLLSAAIDGIAISSDFRYVYYCTLPALALYAIPTSVLRQVNTDEQFASSLIFVGNKTGGSDGMAYGQTKLFYGVFEDNAVYSADVTRGGIISLASQKRIIADDKKVVWVDTFAFNSTDLWFVANKLNLFSVNKMNFTGPEPNMYIWKVDVGEEGYLAGANLRTETSGSLACRGCPIVSFVCVLVFQLLCSCANL